MSKDIIKLVPGAFTIVVAIYGFFHVVTEVFVSFIPFAMLLTAIIVFAIHLLRVPAPSQDLVEAIIGKDLAEETNCEDAYRLKTVAHRGAGMDAPENSLAAFRMCHEKGCDAIEFDVCLTSDGVPVVFHDATLERMADSDLIVSNTKWEDLSKIDLSVKHPYKDRFANTYMPTLYEAVTQMLSDGQRMFIDIKDKNTKMATVILALFETHPELHSRAVVTTFFPNIIYLIRRSNPKIVCSLAYRPHIFTHQYFKCPAGKGPRRNENWYKHYPAILCDIVYKWALPRFTYYLLGISILMLHKDALSAESILEWKNRGIRVIAWTVNSPIEKQHVAKNLKLTYLTDTLTGEHTTHMVFP